MKRSEARRGICHGEVLAGMIERMEGSNRQGELLAACASLRFYEQLACLSLMRIARGRTGHAWEVRREAALMLQRQLLLIPERSLHEHDFWFVQLGLKRRKGLEVPLQREVLKEGFRTRDMKGFIRSWRQRLLRPVGLLETSSNSSAMARWQYLAQGEYRIFLARYLFSAEEVVSRIHGRVRVTKGEEMPYSGDADLIRAEARRASAEMPKYEARILESLCNPAAVHWIHEKPDATIPSLVDCPAGTVALVVRPPGSHMEFEIKRAGAPGHLPLSVIFERDGQEVPPSHRLQGGSMGWHLRIEARAAARFSCIYRAIHGTPPAIAITHCAKSIHTLPTIAGERTLIDFLSSRECFGDGFDSMRHSLRQSVHAFFDEDGTGVRELPGELGRTINFLVQTWPGQAVQSNTSAFRLDRLAENLSPDGASRYFGVSPARRSEPAGALEFGDQLLEEIFGDFSRPRIRPRTYSRYLREVFSMNRRRADRIYLDLLHELGLFWGTLAAVKGYSNGESFVSRNIGIRAAWTDSRWRVGLRFMDQDDLHIADPSEDDFPLDVLLGGMLLDQHYVQGSDGRPNPKSSVFALSQIYRVSSQVRVAGMRALKRARMYAVRKTAAKMARTIPLRDHFSPIFLKRSLECDRLWAAYSRERGPVGANPVLAEELVKRFFPGGSRTKQQAEALRNHGEHFFLNPDS
jgi:hypothetical protein